MKNTQHHIFLIAALCAGLVLTACGGGGGGGDPATIPPSTPTPIAVTPIVVGGLGFSYILKADGTVVSVGDQQNGTLGNGKFSASSTDTVQAVLNLTNITQIDAGNNHGIARRSDGAVFVWGSNSSGQLGIAGSGAIASPQQLALTDIRAVAAGGDFSLALRANGDVFAWGDNSAGQLGLNDNVARLSPVQIPGLSNIVAIAAGTGHSLAISSNGTVFAWGNNLDGQLGLGDKSKRMIPTQIPTLNGLKIKRIAAGEFHSLALTSNGSVFGWGSSFVGEVGVSAPTASGFGDILVPTQVTSLTRPAVAIAAGSRHSLALLDDTTMRTWGHNGSGRLGNGTAGITSSTFIPQIPSVDTVIAIGAGDSHSLIVLSDGQVGCFGDNFFSECGQPSGFSELVNPTQLGSPQLNVNQ